MMLGCQITLDSLQQIIFLIFSCGHLKKKDYTSESSEFIIPVQYSTFFQQFQYSIVHSSSTKIEYFFLFIREINSNRSYNLNFQNTLHT